MRKLYGNAQNHQLGLRENGGGMMDGKSKVMKNPVLIQYSVFSLLTINNCDLCCSGPVKPTETSYMYGTESHTNKLSTKGTVM